MSDFVAFSEDIDAGMEFLEHHGILGQRWGRRNGPPYPLGPRDHSASERKAGWKKSLSTNDGDGSARSRKSTTARLTTQSTSSNRKTKTARAETKQDSKRVDQQTKASETNQQDKITEAKSTGLSSGTKKKIAIAAGAVGAALAVYGMTKMVDVQQIIENSMNAGKLTFKKNVKTGASSAASKTSGVLEERIKSGIKKYGLMRRSGVDERKIKMRRLWTFR